MQVHALVFFDSIQKKRLDSKVYTDGKMSNEFIEFGSKTLLNKIDYTNPEFAIAIGGEFIIYITIVDDLGCGLLMSNIPNNMQLLHLISKKLIIDYTIRNYIPQTSAEIKQYFKHKELIDQIDETKKVLTRTLSQVLERGEKIEELVAKTETLSETSKVFFTNSRNLNSCWGCFRWPRWLSLP
jgi:hypothetical protein